MNDFKEFLNRFDYDSRKEMKIQTPKMLEMVKEDKALIIDIRFKEEYESWHLGFTKNIPLNELPNRLDELPKDKLIVCVCPHEYRSNMAKEYLRFKGLNSRTLTGELVALVDRLKGGKAKDITLRVGI